MTEAQEQRPAPQVVPATTPRTRMTTIGITEMTDMTEAAAGEATADRVDNGAIHGLASQVMASSMALGDGNEEAQGLGTALEVVPQGKPNATPTAVLNAAQDAFRVVWRLFWELRPYGDVFLDVRELLALLHESLWWVIVERLPARQQGPAQPRAKTGTREWADKNVNIQKGCEHDCLYCYAKECAVRRKQTTPERWSHPELCMDKVNKGWRRFDGTIMFPSTHDITPVNLEACAAVLEKLLIVGDNVLVVSKPHLECVRSLCERLSPYREQIVFRFTIGSMDDSVVKYWEPNAPAVAERLECLKYAREQGYKTSVSSEPMLDADIDAVVAAVRPYVSESIWLGRANQLVQAVGRNCPNDPEALEMARALNAVWSDAAVRGLYERYRNDPLIRWKDSIRKVVGLPEGQHPTQCAGQTVVAPGEASQGAEATLSGNPDESEQAA
jgi:hypothetical protein